MAILIGGLLGGHRAGFPGWLLGLLAICVTLVVVNFVALNWYFAIKNPDALRSERFTLTKLAIEQESLRGDDLIGFVRAIADDASTRPLSEPKPPAALPLAEGKARGSPEAGRASTTNRSRKTGEPPAS